MHLLTVDILVFLTNQMVERPAYYHWIGLFASQMGWFLWIDGQKRQYVNMDVKVSTENLNYFNY